MIDEYDPDHFKTPRNSGLRKSDFKQDESRLLVIAAYIAALSVLLAGAVLMGVIP